jgi:hypothetical protein
MLQPPPHGARADEFMRAEAATAMRMVSVCLCSGCGVYVFIAVKVHFWRLDLAKSRPPVP